MNRSHLLDILSRRRPNRVWPAPRAESERRFALSGRPYGVPTLMFPYTGDHLAGPNCGMLRPILLLFRPSVLSARTGADEADGWHATDRLDPITSGRGSGL